MKPTLVFLALMATRFTTFAAEPAELSPLSARHPTVLDLDPETARVIDFVCRLRYEDLPKPVVSKAKALIADALSAMVLGAAEPEGRALRQYVKLLSGGSGSCAIVGADFSASPALAAFANAAQAQIHDANDGWPWAEAKRTCAHPGRLVVPTALACAESRNASGRELIVAVVAGYEFAGRAQKMTGASRDTYVSALVAGKLAGLDANLLSQALVMAAYNSPGRAGLPGPHGDEYWLSNGLTARAGIEAVALVRGGFRTADVRALRKMPWDMVTEKPGERWLIMETYVKPYPSCRNTHAAVDLAISMAKKYNLRATDIARVDISLWHGLYVGAERIEPDAGRIRAQLNIHHCVASALRDGTLDTRNFSPSAIADGLVRGLAEKVHLHKLPAVQRRPDMPIHFAVMTITTSDGERIDGQADFATGDPQMPLSPQKAQKMYIERFQRVLQEEQSQRLYDAVQRTEDFTDVGELTELLRIAQAK